MNLLSRACGDDGAGMFRQKNFGRAGPECLHAMIEARAGAEYNLG
jgi:hypothetical protein